MYKMNTVGADKRTQYYRMAPEEVLTVLKSHQMGLTNTEAARRHTNQGANILPNVTTETAASGLLRAAGHPFVALTAIAVVIANDLVQANLALVLLACLIVHIALRYRVLRGSKSIPLDILLPPHAKVTRNDQTRSIETAYLVVGDIVHVSAGEIVPADVRLIDENDVVTDDAQLLGGHLQTRKFIHAISKAVPLLARNNQLWAGTIITRGEGRGVVIAIGAQTELGRVALLRAAAERSANQQRDSSAIRYLYIVGALGVLLAVALLGWQAGVEPLALLTTLLTLMVALVPNGLGIARFLLERQARWRLKHQGVDIAQTDALSAFGSADLLVIDAANPMTHAVSATTLLIGRDTYAFAQSGYEPSGEILNNLGKPVSKKQLATMRLLFEASTFATAATVLQPDTNHPEWHTRGNPYEAAVVVAARKAGLNTEQLRTKYEELRVFPYDAGRALASSVRRYGDDLVLFVRGNPAAVLAQSKKIWDHGHVRALSDNDRRFFGESQAASASMAFAYRILPTAVNPDKIDMTKVEQDLTFLGIINIESTSSLDELAASAQRLGLRTVTISTEATPGAITSLQLGKLSDEALVSRLTASGTTFSRLTSEDILRIVATSQQHSHMAVMAGASLIDLPATTLATASISLEPSRQSNSISPSSLTIRSLAAFSTAVSGTRQLSAKLQALQQLAIVQTSAVSALAVISVIGAWYDSLPLALTIPLILVIELLAVPIAGFAAQPDTKATRKELVVAGIGLAVLAYAAFLSFFAIHQISPVFISQDSRFALGAMTTSLSAIFIGLWIHIFVNAAQNQRIESRAQLRWAFAVSAVVLLNAVYNPWLQPLLGTIGLDRPDWLIAFAAAALYAGLRFFQHHTRAHSREAVIRLHHEVHGQK